MLVCEAFLEWVGRGGRMELEPFLATGEPGDMARPRELFLECPGVRHDFLSASSNLKHFNTHKQGTHTCSSR